MPEPARLPRTASSATALALLAALVALFPLARGGVDAPAQGLALSMAGGAALLATWSVREVRWASIGLAAVVCAVALQLVPFPAAIHTLSPAARAIFKASLSPVGQYPAPRPLTLDIPATAIELAKAATCLAAFMAASVFAETRRRRSKLVAAVGLGAGLVACAVFVAAVLRLQPFLAPRFPFVNPNHLAGFLDLTAFVALGLATRTHGQGRAAWAIVFTGAVAALFASLSRSGIAAFFIGLSLYGGLFLWRRGAAPVQRRIAVLAGVTAVALGAAAYLALAPVERELETVRTVTQEAKIALWPSGARMVRDFPLAGAGRGAFRTVFPAYKDDPTLLTFTHLENEWLQVLIDLGLPAGLLLILTYGAIWLLAARRRDVSPTEIGLLAGAGALLAHDVFDFSLEVLGVAVPFSIAMGLLSRGSRTVSISRWVTRSVLAVFVVAGALGLVFGARHAADPGVAISKAVPEEAIRIGTDAMSLRPADYLPLAAVGARLAEEGRCAEALPWLTRATAFAPGIPEAHLAVGRCLAARGSGVSARREYRLAVLLGRSDALAEAAERWPDLDALYQVAPETPEGLFALGALLARDRPEDARAVYRRILDEFGDERALVPLADVAVAAGDGATALDLAHRRMQTAPTDEQAYRVASLALVLEGKEEEARGELERGIAAVPGSPGLLHLLAARLMAVGRFSEARKAAERIAARTPAEVVLREEIVAGALAAQGRYGEAIERARFAASIQPDVPGPVLIVAQLCSAAGRYDEAIAAFERAAALPGAAPGAYASRIGELRAKLADQEARHRDALLRSEDQPLPGAP